ncbi:unnamed protein product [Psylliodes chrysocephalus]|uniref:HAT C-terminal dimerisation domain-containing protein n=1 Tax=Psylliodes chrysocephalus TaxID=3402493 RepID=A0A9P0CEP0_9CUCU|nr:unnamed protein product [Psylliodes chrysocephala]
MDKWLIKRTSKDPGGGSPNNASQIKRIKHVVLDNSVASTMTTTVTSNISCENNAATSSTSSVITIDDSRATSSSTTITISHNSDDCSSIATSTLHIDTESDASTSIKQATATSETTGKRQRIFKESYIQFGFKCTVLNFEQRPQCVICSEVSANESMKPAKLKRHLETKHPQLKNKDESYFKRLATKLTTQQVDFQKYTTVNQKALQASFEVSFLIAKNKKPHNIGETLILPAAMKIVSIMQGEKYANVLKTIPLSSDTVHRRINLLADDIKIQLIDHVKESPYYAIQLDESTDVANVAQLLIFIRYRYENDICEDLLFCQGLKGRTTGEAIFNAVNTFFELHDIKWEYCVSVCTDGAAALTGSKTGFKAKVTEIAPHVGFVHCMIHREALAAKHLQPDVNKVLEQVVTIINFIKARALNSRLFKIMCREMGSEYENLLLHTEVRWLSRGKILRRVFDLKDEIRIFLLEREPKLAEYFLNENWLATVGYLSDIFEKLNDLNLSLQGKSTNVLILANKIKAFCKKISLWIDEISAENYEMFACLEKFSEENNIKLEEEIKTKIMMHLTNLKQDLEIRFPDTSYGDQWIINPFTCDLNTVKMNLKEKEQLIDLMSDESLRSIFKTTDLSKFWIMTEKNYPLLFKTSLLKLLPFASTYLCETAFSTLTAVKTKYRSRLNVEPDLRVPVSDNISPRINILTASVQSQGSH